MVSILPLEQQICVLYFLILYCCSYFFLVSYFGITVTAEERLAMILEIVQLEMHRNAKEEDMEKDMSDDEIDEEENLDANQEDQSEDDESTIAAESTPVAKRKRKQKPIENEQPKKKSKKQESPKKSSLEKSAKGKSSGKKKTAME